ncbi:hypothetical protein XfCFBP8078_13115 [Xylella fastidiosa subsp. multiplex]|nr:hypothetical protein XfCFBP8078_13115 [Xylella fastidiosa subsp. multiplex]
MSLIAFIQTAVSILLKTDEISNTLVYVLMKWVLIIVGYFAVNFGVLDLFRRKIQAKQLIFIIFLMIFINFSSFFLGYLIFLGVLNISLL